LASETIMNAESQTNDFLRDDHQRSCDVQRVGSIVGVLTMNVNAGQVGERNNHNKSEEKVQNVKLILVVCVCVHVTFERFVDSAF